MVACSVARVELASFRILRGRCHIILHRPACQGAFSLVDAHLPTALLRPGRRGPILTEQPGSGMECAFRRAASVAPRRVGRWGA